MLAFGKAHYEIVAIVIQDAVKAAADAPDRLAAVIDLRNRFVAAFRADNPKFESDRFIAACEPGANVKARGRRSGGAR